MQLDKVIYKVTGHIAKIIMNRPDKRNALNYQLLNDLDAAFGMADQDLDIRVVILSATGPAFCAGYDIKDSPYTNLPAGDSEWTKGNALRTLKEISQRYLMIKDLSKPVIAQVQGYCLAAGCYLQMCCDIAVASTDAVFGHPVAPGGGVSSMPLWVTYLGERKAKEFLFTGRFVDGNEAVQIGLVNKAVPPEQLDEEVWEMAKIIAAADPEEMQFAKEAINTHTQIVGRDAIFSYHRQLNALGRLGPKKRKLDIPGSLNKAKRKNGK